MLGLSEDICKQLAGVLVNEWIEAYGRQEVIATIVDCDMNFEAALYKLNHDLYNVLAAQDTAFTNLYDAVEPYMVNELKELWEVSALDDVKAVSPECEKLFKPYQRISHVSFD